MLVDKQDREFVEIEEKAANLKEQLSQLKKMQESKGLRNSRVINNLLNCICHRRGPLLKRSANNDDAVSDRISVTPRAFLASNLPFPCSSAQKEESADATASAKHKSPFGGVNKTTTSRNVSLAGVVDDEEMINLTSAACTSSEPENMPAVIKAVCSFNQIDELTEFKEEPASECSHYILKMSHLFIYFYLYCIPQV